MAILGAGNSTRIQTNNKVGDILTTGSYNVTIVDEWVHYVTKEQDGNWDDGRPRYRSKYSKDVTDNQEIKISVSLDDDPTIILETRLAAYITDKSNLGKIISSLFGKPIEEIKSAGFDSKLLRGMKAVADVKSRGEYVDVKGIRARPKPLVRPTIKPIAHETFDDRGNIDDLDENEIPF